MAGGGGRSGQTGHSGCQPLTSETGEPLTSETGETEMMGDGKAAVKGREGEGKGGGCGGSDHLDRTEGREGDGPPLEPVRLRWGWDDDNQ